MKRESYAPLVVAIALMLIPVLYVGSYLALVNPSGYAFATEDNRIRPCNYRLGGEFSAWAYLPLETIDRYLRPHRWDQSDPTFIDF
ncbi:hypothetical protein [Anatilimnocola floriformis]|uniref:hypothetical protein n=1 Tax=Anatilimnocola floriformis TaxID=2948575 RepID=UPI0020C1ECBE|nr:hypothetical protein [Anatilimnocola floriformis]